MQYIYKLLSLSSFLACMVLFITPYSPAVAQGALDGGVKVGSYKECENICRGGEGTYCNFSYYFIETKICKTSIDRQPHNYGIIKNGYAMYSSWLDKQVFKSDIKKYWPSFFSKKSTSPTSPFAPPRTSGNTPFYDINTTGSQGGNYQNKQCTHYANFSLANAKGYINNARRIANQFRIIDCNGDNFYQCRNILDELKLAQTEINQVVWEGTTGNCRKCDLNASLSLAKELVSWEKWFIDDVGYNSAWNFANTFMLGIKDHMNDPKCVSRPPTIQIQNNVVNPPLRGNGSLTGKKVLVRGTPIIKNGSTVKRKKTAGNNYFKETVKISDGSGYYHYIYGSNKPGKKPVEDFQITYQFDPPPAILEPNKKIILNSHATVSGYSNNGGSYRILYSSHELSIKKSNKRVSRNTMPATGEACGLDCYKHRGSGSVSNTATISVGKNPGKNVSITIRYNTNLGRASITYPYTLQ